MRFYSMSSAVLRRAIATSALTALSGFAAPALAQSDLPTGGAVASGTATISGGGGAVSVDQASTRAIVNWTSFDVGVGKSVIFRQPDANSATLNRVTGGTSSTIAGQISANGAVYLINPNGIAITASGTVQTGGGFIGSTLDIADGDFTAGRLAFAGTNTAARISNAGSITAGAGGYVALLGGQVSNSGTISVPLGKVALGAGETITLDLNGNAFLQVAVPSALVANGSPTGGRVTLKVGTVRDAIRGIINLPARYSADSVSGGDGTILLTNAAAHVVVARAAASVSGASLTNSGTISASGGRVALTSAGVLTSSGTIMTDSASADGGRIDLFGDSVIASGTLSARATGASGNGGFVETSGKAVDFTGLKVDATALGGKTGTWLIDPVDLTIDAAAAATIGTNLATANVALQTTATTASGSGNQTPGNGDITIASGITWTGANTLSLLAYNNIALNAAINGTNGGLTLSTGNAVANTGTISTSASGTVTVGVFNLTNGAWGQNSTTLPGFSATDFRFNPANATFLRVTGGTGASGTPYQIADVYGLQGIASSTLLADSFLLVNSVDASGTANWNAGAGWVPIGTDGAGAALNSNGFTGSFNGGDFTLSNLTINRPTTNYVGLFGYMNNAGSLLSNLGLIGGMVRGNYSVGSLGGFLGYGNISNMFATTNVIGGGEVGGLYGSHYSGTVTNVYATGSVLGGPNDFVGGLAGHEAGTLSNAYATGSVTSTGNFTGGLVGGASGALRNVYATGSVTSIGSVSSTGANTGGLVGYQLGGTITSAHATGLVMGAVNVGGLVGYRLGQVTNSYWDSYSTGQALATSAGNVSGATAVTSDPTQSGAANYAYKATAYGNLTAASGIGTTTPTGFVFMPGDTTRPFLAFEVPSSALLPTINGALVLTNSHQLQLIGYDATRLAGSYVLNNSIDLTETARVVAGTSNSYSGMWAGTGWVPIGTDGASRVLNTNGFTGSFNGGDFTLSNLTINRPTTNYVGLFGYMNHASSLLSNLGLIGGTVTGGAFVGSLGGFLGSGNISNIFATTNVIGRRNVGGLYGQHVSGTVNNVYATGSVLGGIVTGGLAGYEAGTLSNAYATGSVTSTNNYTGGLVGESYGALSNVYATGSVTSTGIYYTGGLVGGQAGGGITSAYATGRVTGRNYVGGLVGFHQTYTLTNSYWDSYSTGQTQASGSASNIPGVNAITSDPAQSAAANYAYKSSAYANLTVASGIGTTSPTGFVFVAGNTTRPSLAFEVPTAALAGTNAAGQILISNAHQLQLIGYNAATNAARYALTSNIDLSETGAVTVGTSASYAGMWAGTGWVPLGTDGAGNAWNGSGYALPSTIAANGVHGFSGSLDGAGHSVSNLTINRSTIKNVGLFGVTSGALSNVTLGGTVTGFNGVGGLVGLLYTGGSVTGATSTASVTGNNLVGGLVGNATDGSRITRSSASGTISGVANVGGLVGYASGATISRAFATGNVTGVSYAGGLVGYLYNSAVSNSYATGTTNATRATAGGLIGYQNGGSVVNSYAANPVASLGNKGGLIGQLTNSGTVLGSYWDTTLSGLATSAGGTGRTTAQLQDLVNYATNYAGWDFTTVWLPPTTGAHPKLR